VTALANPRAVIGDNAEPESEPTPFQIAEKAVNDVCGEATLWLDGHPIDSQDLADGVANLLAEIRKAEKLADDTRVAENAPFDAGKAEVQRRYLPLIGDTKAVRGKTVLASLACKAALAPWLAAEDRRIKAEAAAAREEADRQRREAEEALRASDATNLAAREAAEALLHAAKRAEVTANVAGRQTATAGGSFGRAAGLRANWTATITDPTEAARTCWRDAQPEMLEFLQGWAERRVREGARTLPGFSIVLENKVA
jgi:hypothetical protein